MSTSVSEIPSLPATQTLSHRVVSIDVFRGLTMAMMIFVNALPEDAGLPWWTYHAHAKQDLMTYVDMVFPFFLFIVGMSMPLSVSQRLKRNPSMPALWLHVFIRAASLIVLGLVLANAEKGDSARMGINHSLWALLALVCAGLYLNVYPKSGRWPRYAMTLRVIGVVGLVILFAVFRRTTRGGLVAWIDPEYPEILGLIGFSYLAVAALYIPTRRWKWAPSAWFALLLTYCACSTAGLTPLTAHLPIYDWPFSNGAMACLIMAGIVTSQIFLDHDRRWSPTRAIAIASGLGVLMLLAGLILTPLGISKIRATPTWCLYSIGGAILSFALLFWICDVKGWTRWAWPVRAAGSNTLTTYLLPDIWYFLFSALGVTYLDTHLAYGWGAVIKTVVFTLVMLGLSWLMTKCKVRLQL